MKMKYIATQLTPEGLDEVQRVLLGYHLGQHLALSGPPGVGKTALITALPKIVKRPIFEITCDALMTEAPLVGFPELEGENGSTVKVWKNGEATKAAAENGIFYGDEFDQLSGPVQKRLNSLFDDRRHIKRRDGVEIKAGDNFLACVSYNPSDRLSRRELEEAVADRFVHMSFGYLPSRVEAAIALDDTSMLNANDLEERAIQLSDGNIRYLRREKQKWQDFFTGEYIKHPESTVVYSAFVGDLGHHEFPANGYERTGLAVKLAHFFDSVRTFADNGTNKLPNDVKTYLKEIGEVTNVPLHKPSVRILQAAIAQYDILTQMGMEPGRAQSYVTQLCIDQVGYGKFGLRPLGKGTVRDALTSMAQFYDLLKKPKQRTDF